MRNFTVKIMCIHLKQKAWSQCYDHDHVHFFLKLHICYRFFVNSYAREKKPVTALIYRFSFGWPFAILTDDLVALFILFFIFYLLSCLINIFIYCFFATVAKGLMRDRRSFHRVKWVFSLSSECADLGNFVIIQAYVELARMRKSAKVGTYEKKKLKWRNFFKLHRTGARWTGIPTWQTTLSTRILHPTWSTFLCATGAKTIEFVF